MHIEPGVVQGAKMLLSYGAAAVSLGIAAKFALVNLKSNGLWALAIKSCLTTVVVFTSQIGRLLDVSSVLCAMGRMDYGTVHRCSL
jgi:hypothetical protein